MCGDPQHLTITLKQGRFSEEQIVTILKAAEAGAKPAELRRRHGISDATFYIYGRLPDGMKARVLF
jgi:putative transposase